MASDDDGFLSRWSRRKQQVRAGQPLPPEPTPAPAALPVAAAVPAAPAPVVQPPEPEQPPPPTMADVAGLTPQDDFSRFVARGVTPDVRNAAVKKLFTDPHFNVMDGLDIYIDDYSKPSPLSKADLAMMVGARFLKLVDDPDQPTQPTAPAAPVTAAIDRDAAADAPPVEPIPDSGPTAANPGAPETAALPPPHDDHADLQLQPDHAPERESAGRGTG